MNLHYETNICQKIYNTVTTHNKSKCLVQICLHQTLGAYSFDLLRCYTVEANTGL